MRKERLIIWTALVMLFFLGVWAYKVNISSKLTPEEKAKIITLVNSYYNNMMNKDYKGALDLVDITESEYDKALSTLNNNKEYVVRQNFEGNHWIISSKETDDPVYYDKTSNCFIVEIGAKIIYNGSPYEATEEVYIKRIGKNFKVVKIITDDRFSSIRGAYLIYRN